VFLATDPLVLVPILVGALFVLIVLAVTIRYAGIWFRAFMSGAPISAIELIGMTFRRTNVSAVVRAVVMAKQGGVDVSYSDLERAYLQGVDLEKVTLAAIEAKKQGIEIAFDELVDAERRDRLSEKLKAKE